jgi:hypothetical protein
MPQPTDLRAEMMNELKARVAGRKVPLTQMIQPINTQRHIPIHCVILKFVSDTPAGILAMVD